MRPIFLAALLTILFITPPAHARLGETEDQCIARYGAVLSRKTTNIIGPPLTMLAFMKNGFMFSAILLDGKVGFVQIQKTDQSDLSDNEINTFLDANSANQKWIKQNIVSTKIVWFRDDESQAQYDPANQSLYLISKAYIDASDAAKKAAEAQKLKGF